MTEQAKSQPKEQAGGLIAWLANSRLAFLVPFWFAEESYSGGVMLLCVKRHGRECFETYDWGVHTTAAEKERLLWPCSRGTRQRYEALQHLVRCGIVKRIGTASGRWRPGHRGDADEGGDDLHDHNGGDRRVHGGRGGQGGAGFE